MGLAELIALIGISFTAAWTPGPNNTLVANSGARFGYRATLPHIMGITLGFPFMVFCIALGLGALFQHSVLLREGLRILGIIVLLFFAWKVANAGRIDDDTSAVRPFSFLQSAAFQWINPKALAMSVSISSQYSDPDHPVYSAAIMASVFIAAGFTSASAWTLFGQVMRRWLKSDRAALIFNLSMAILLVVSVLLIAFSAL